VHVACVWSLSACSLWRDAAALLVRIVFTRRTPLVFAVGHCFPPLRDSQRDAVLVNACGFVQDSNACGLVYFGIFTKGLHATSQTFSSLVQELLAKRGRADGNPAIAKVGEERDVRATASGP
jgi:hypothetical protein